VPSRYYCCQKQRTQQVSPSPHYVPINYKTGSANGPAWEGFVGLIIGIDTRKQKKTCRVNPDPDVLPGK
jgi:hypothetical protein